MKVNFTGGFIKIAHGGKEKYINVDTIRKVYCNENPKDDEGTGKTAIYYVNNFGFETVDAPASKVAAACIKAQQEASIVSVE